MKIYNYHSVLQEVPDELSLCFNVYGCPHRCKNCSWEGNTLPSTQMDLLDYHAILAADNNKSSCICFMGGEWDNHLVEYLILAKNLGYKTCLYTGAKLLPTNLIPYLDYLKVGEYKDYLGGLDSPTTNQRFLTIGDKTKCFQRNKF